MHGFYSALTRISFWQLLMCVCTFTQCSRQNGFVYGWFALSVHLSDRHELHGLFEFLRLCPSAVVRHVCHLLLPLLHRTYTNTKDSICDSFQRTKGDTIWFRYCSRTKLPNSRQQSTTWRFASVFVVRYVSIIFRSYVIGLKLGASSMRKIMRKVAGIAITCKQDSVSSGIWTIRIHNEIDQ